MLQSNLPLEIQVVDPETKNISKFENLLESNSKNLLSFNFEENLDFDEETFDLAIVSTTADVRSKITAELLRNHSVKNPVLEKLITSSTSDLKKLSEVLTDNCAAWVNYPRRLTSLYKSIDENLKLTSNPKLR